MASRMFNGGMYQIINQATNFATDDIRVLLVSSTYTFNPTSEFVSNISNELSTTNYARQALVNTSITQDDVNDRVVLDANDVTWSALGPASGGPVAKGTVIFRHTGLDGTSPVLVYNEFSSATQVNGGDFTVEWNAANGIVESVSP